MLMMQPTAPKKLDDLEFDNPSHNETHRVLDKDKDPLLKDGSRKSLLKKANITNSSLPKNSIKNSGERN